jgi:hypothetical protein
MIDAVLDVLAERSPRLRDIVAAARDPASSAGLARRARRPGALFTGVNNA